MQSGNQKKNDDIFEGLEWEHLDFGDTNPDDFFQDIEPLSEEQLTWLNNFCDRGKELKEILDCIRENNERKAVDILLANENLSSYFTVDDELSVGITLNDVLKLLQVFAKKRMHKMIREFFNLNPVLQDYFSGKPVNLEGVGAEPQALDLAQAKSQFEMALHLQSRLISQILWNNYPALSVEILNSKEPQMSTWLKLILASENKALIKYICDNHRSWKDKLLALPINEALIWLKSILASRNQPLIKYFVDNHASLKNELLMLPIENALTLFKSILSSRNRTLIKYFFDNHPALKYKLLNLTGKEVLVWFKSILCCDNQKIINYFWGHHEALQDELLKLTGKEALVWFKSILTSRSQKIIDHLWENHEALWDELLKLTGKKALVWFKRILSSRNKKLINHIWEHHDALRDELMRLTGKEVLTWFKSILSSHNDVLADYFFENHNKVLLELIEAMPNGEKRALLKSVLCNCTKIGKLINRYLNLIQDLDLLYHVYKDIAGSKNSRARGKLPLLAKRIKALKNELKKNEANIVHQDENDQLFMECSQRALEPEQVGGILPVSNDTNTMSQASFVAENSRNKKRKRNSEQYHSDGILIHAELPTLEQLEGQKRFYVSQEVAKKLAQLRNYDVAFGLKFRKVTRQEHYNVTIDNEEDYLRYIGRQEVPNAGSALSENFLDHSLYLVERPAQINIENPSSAPGNHSGLAANNNSVTIAETTGMVIDDSGVNPVITTISRSSELHFESDAVMPTQPFDVETASDNSINCYNPINLQMGSAITFFGNKQGGQHKKSSGSTPNPSIENSTNAAFMSALIKD